MNLKELQKKLPYKWRVQSFSKYNPSATCVAYIDARDAATLLDEVVGADNWQVKYKEVGGMLFAGVGIKVEDEWIWKWDTGSESQVEKEKGHVSDAFKRACVQWGIGRFLYSMDMKYVKANEVKKDGNYPYVVNENGDRVYNLTEYINGKKKDKPKTVSEVEFGKLRNDYLEKKTMTPEMREVWGRCDKEQRKRINDVTKQIRAERDKLNNNEL